jgi:hypothetical protein
MCGWARVFAQNAFGNPFLAVTYDLGESGGDMASKPDMLDVLHR